MDEFCTRTYEVSNYLSRVVPDRYRSSVPVEYVDVEQCSGRALPLLDSLARKWEYAHWVSGRFSGTKWSRMLDKFYGANLLVEFFPKHDSLWLVMPHVDPGAAEAYADALRDVLATAREHKVDVIVRIEGHRCPKSGIYAVLKQARYRKTNYMHMKIWRIPSCESTARSMSL